MAFIFNFGLIIKFWYFSETENESLKEIYLIYYRIAFESILHLKSCLGNITQVYESFAMTLYGQTRPWQYHGHSEPVEPNLPMFRLKPTGCLSLK